MDSIFQFFSQIGDAFKSLSPSKRLSIIIIIVVTLVSIGAFVFFINQKEYKTLFSNLSTEDAGKIVASLEEKKIPYKLSATGESILVPAGEVSKLRLDLASSGLLQGGGVGFEIFDNKNFGVTDFVQQLNYQRALQGELSRTINSLDEILQSRVHIVLPKKSLFVEQQGKPEVSVIIKLKSGVKLRTSQIDGITHLVAASIEGLQPEEVTIVDTGGNILSKPESGSQLSKQTDSQIDYQRNIEKGLEKRIQSMLERVVGEGKVVARVSAALDFKVVEKTEEAYDPEEPVVRSLHRKNEKGSKSDSGGESTVSPTTGLNQKAASTNNEKSDETINYEINRVISKTMMPVGQMERLSVAVMVDDVYTKNDKGVEESRPRTKKEIETLETLVKSSVGFDAKRGDQVVVTSVSFKKIDLETGPAEEGSWKTKFYPVVQFIKYLVPLIGLVLVLLFVIRPLIKVVLIESKMKELDKIGSLAIAGGGVSLEDKGVSPEQVEPVEAGPKEIELVRSMAEKDARRFAALLRNWL